MATILSVDWDYFLAATTGERITMFPDGGNENLIIPLQNYVWLTQYATSIIKAEKFGSKIMTDIKADNSELDNLYDLIKKHKKKNTKMSVYESHKNIADIFKIDEFICDNHDVINIDYHHDCFNTSDDSNVNCGNWGKLLLEQGKIKNLYWVKREDSDDDNIAFIKKIYCGIQELFNDNDSHIFEDGIDHIFICRSAVWTPPHLDDKFIQMVLKIKHLLDKGNIKGLYDLIRRWDEQAIENIDTLTDEFRQALNMR